MVEVQRNKGNKRDNQKKIASTNELLISIRFFQIFKK